MQCENVVGPICCEKVHYVESCEAAAAVVLTVGIIQRVANNLDTFSFSNILRGTR